MTSIPYDSTRNALFHPGRTDNFFELGPLQNDAALCAEMSRLAYVKEASRLAPYLARAQFDQVQAIGYPTIGTQVFIATRHGDALTVVAFRGSELEDPSDLFADAEFKLADWCDAAGAALGKVYGGFARAAYDEDIFRRVNVHLETLPPAHRVLITGHSLGGALATLMASWRPAAHLHTFGAPRVGNAAFAAAVKNPVARRFVNCCDIVSRVPPEGVLGYTHAGTLAYIDRKGKLQASIKAAAMLEDYARAQAEFLPYALVRGTVYSRDLADHAPINYVSGVMGLRG